MVCKLSFNMEGEIVVKKWNLQKKKRFIASWLVLIFCLSQFHTKKNVEDIIQAQELYQEVNEETAVEEEESVNNSETVTDSAIKPTATPLVPKASVAIKFAKKSIKIWPGKKKKNAVTIKKTAVKSMSVKWSVRDKTLASVSQKGMVTLKEKGAGKKVTVTVKVSYIGKDGKKKSKSASYVVNGQQPVKSIKVTGKKNYVFIGKTLKLQVTYSPKKASVKKVKWSSSNKNYATITKNGVIKPKKAGYGKTVTFTAKASDGYKATQKIKIRIIDPNRPMVALTFDDGPSALYTKRIVAQLKKYDAHATFFVLGSMLNSKETKAIIKKADDNGNEIASHTYNHKRLSALSVAEIQKEMLMTKNAIKSITGKEPLCMRPPYGSLNDTVKSSVSLPCILWSIDTLDWKTRNQANTVSVVLNRVQDGDVVLMHDIHAPTAGAAEQLIPELVKRGYQLVTVSELATYKGVKLKNGSVYTRIK